MSKRREKILEVTGSMFPEQFEKSSMETMQLCEKESSRLVSGFLKALSEAVKQAACKEETSNDSVQYLLFSCLHSSIFLRKYLIRIDLMSQEFYHDEPLATSYWDVGDIYGLFERDISEFRRKMEGKVPRLKEYEMDYVRYAYAPYYHRMAKTFIKEMLEEILLEIENSRQEVSDCGLNANESQKMLENTECKGQIRILFGEYMGEADRLFTVGKEQFYEIFQNLCR